MGQVANAVLIDANGSGRYDDFPLKPGQPLKVVEHSQTPRVPTADELARAIVKLSPRVRRRAPLIDPYQPVEEPH